MDRQINSTNILIQQSDSNEPSQTQTPAVFDNSVLPMTPLGRTELEQNPLPSSLFLSVFSDSPNETDLTLEPRQIIFSPIIRGGPERNPITSVPLPYLSIDGLSQTEEVLTIPEPPRMRLAPLRLRTNEDRITQELIRVNVVIECTSFECSMCFDTTPNGGIFTTRCKHSFCISCVAKWVLAQIDSARSNNVGCTCPLCRQVFLTM